MEAHCDEPKRNSPLITAPAPSLEAEQSSGALAAMAARLRPA
jgi:hypothetical protein